MYITYTDFKKEKADCSLCKHLHVCKWRADMEAYKETTGQLKDEKGYSPLSVVVECTEYLKNEDIKTSTFYKI